MATAKTEHGKGVRGLTGVQGPGDLGGRFSRIFPGSAEMASVGEDALLALARRMIAPREDPEDGEDPQEGHIPAAYTYFGQFIDHDLTFDPSTFQQQVSDPTGIEDYRTPRFDLDNLYGRGPQDQPYLFDGKKFLLGEELEGVERNPKPRDLPRAPLDGRRPPGRRDRNRARRALICDPRNDENAIVSQLHGLFLRFHNLMVERYPDESFDAVQRRVRWHYQWVLLHDFLPRIVARHVLDDISPAIADPDITLAEEQPRLILDIKKDDFEHPTIPVEFSVAAYRFGHSMVRSSYRVSEARGPLPIFHTNPARGLNGFDSVKSGKVVDWQRFIDLGMRSGAETRRDRVQMAYKIDTSLVEPLAHLPQSVAGEEADQDVRFYSLAYRNLVRGKKLLLPSGQEVARRLGLEPMKDDEILIGRAESPRGRGRPAPLRHAVSIADIPGFAGRCPLWVYVLAESRRNYFSRLGKAQLGEVGGRIVAEVFLTLLRKDQSSFVATDPNWRPREPFTLKELIADALSYEESDPVRRTARRRSRRRRTRPRR